MYSNVSGGVGEDFYGFVKVDVVNGVQVGLLLSVSLVLGTFLLGVLLHSFREHPLVPINERLFKFICQVGGRVDSYQNFDACVA